MQFHLNWDSRVLSKFPELAICIGIIHGVHVEKENEQIQKLKESVYREMRAKYNIETLKDNPIVRAYRDFYWKLNIDPTKTRPSGEALLRRVLHGEDLPRISTVVDAYNLASMKTIIPISGFDEDRLSPPFQLRFANNGETFTGIGMSKPLILTNNMLVLADERQVLCIYPYRDADYTKITEKTKNVVIIGYGAPGIERNQLTEAVETLFHILKLFLEAKFKP
jgi:DNA/RNA-binding domain of Phe-tRNA-synthetase-like protein